MIPIGTLEDALMKCRPLAYIRAHSIERPIWPDGGFMASKPPIKLSDLFEELDRLTPEDAQRMRDTLAEIGEGHLGEAYLELMELVGRDTALAMLLDEMLGPVILPDGSMVARNSIAKIAQNKLN